MKSVAQFCDKLIYNVLEVLLQSMRVNWESRTPAPCPHTPVAVGY